MMIQTRYFERIDTPDKAYWLGVLMAKGRVITSKKGLRFLTLRSKHYELAGGLAEDLGGVIPNVGDAGQVSLTLREGSLIDDLARYGVVEGKSRLDYLAGDYVRVDDALFRDFLRGMFDANGHLDTLSSGRAGASQRLRFVIGHSNAGLIEYLRQEIDRLYGLHVNVDNGSYCLAARVLGRANVLKMREILYYEGMRRYVTEKHAAAFSVPEAPERPVGVNVGLVPITEEVQHIVAGLLTVMSQSALGRLVGMSHDAVGRLIRGDRRYLNETAMGRILELGQEAGLLVKA